MDYGYTSTENKDKTTSCILDRKYGLKQAIEVTVFFFSFLARMKKKTATSIKHAQKRKILSKLCRQMV